MIEWSVYSDGATSLRIPKRLKKSSPGLLFKGRLKASDPRSELWVVVESNVNPSLVERTREAMAMLPMAGESMDTAFTYRYRGESRTRPGGFEQKMSVRGPGQQDQARTWSIIFAICGNWVQIRVDNIAGGLSWEEIEDVGNEIIKSVQLSDHVEPARRSRSPGKGLDLSDSLRLRAATRKLPPEIEYLRSAILAIGKQDQGLLGCGEADTAVLEESLRKTISAAEVEGTALAHANALRAWLTSLSDPGASWAAPAWFVEGFVRGFATLDGG